MRGVSFPGQTRLQSLSRPPRRCLLPPPAAVGTALKVMAGWLAPRTVTSNGHSTALWSLGSELSYRAPPRPCARPIGSATRPDWFRSRFTGSTDSNPNPPYASPDVSRSYHEAKKSLRSKKTLDQADKLTRRTRQLGRRFMGETNSRAKAGSVRFAAGATDDDDDDDEEADGEGDTVGNSRQDRRRRLGRGSRAAQGKNASRRRKKKQATTEDEDADGIDEMFRPTVPSVNVHRKRGPPVLSSSRLQNAIDAADGPENHADLSAFAPRAGGRKGRDKLQVVRSAGGARRSRGMRRE